MPEVQEVFRMATQKVRPDPGALERQGRTQRRRSVTQRMGGYAVVAILAIAAVLIAVFATGQREERPAGQGEEEPSAAGATGPFFLDLATAETTPLPESIGIGEDYGYVVSPDGTRLAYSPGKCSGGPVGVAVASVDGTGVRTIEPPDGGTLCGPQWSPDGTKLVYQERIAHGQDVGNVFLHDLSSGRKTQVTDLELTKAGWWWLAPSFTADGQNILFQLPRSRFGETRWDVWSVPVTGGEPTLVLRDASLPMDMPSGPEGSQIAFLQPQPNDPFGERIMIGRPIGDSEFRQTLVEANEEIAWPSMSPDGQRITYQDGGSVHVVEVETGESSAVAEGEAADWLDNDTLIVKP